MCWFFRKGQQQGIVVDFPLFHSMSLWLLLLHFLTAAGSRQERSKEERKEESQPYYSHIMLMSGLSPPPPPVDRPRVPPLSSLTTPPAESTEEKKGEIWGKEGIKRIKTYSIKFHSYATPQGRAHMQVFLVLLPPARRNPKKLLKKGKERMDERCQHGILGTFIPPFPSRKLIIDFCHH